VKIPPQGEAVAEFDPKGLPVGAHELKVDSLSSGGAPYSVTVAFRRVAGPFDR
jgi:hypothetical protein